MRRVIKKNRVIEWKIFETNDSSLGGEKILAYETKRILIYSSTLDQSGEFLIRSKIKIAGTIVNNRVQQFSNFLPTTSASIGDNQFLSAYGSLAQIKELWHRLHKFQIRNMQDIGAVNPYALVTKMDFRPINNLKVFNTTNTFGVGNASEVLGLQNNLNLQNFISYFNATNTDIYLNISMLEKLEYFIWANGNLKTVSLPLVSILKVFVMNSNKLTSLNLSSLVQATNIRVHDNPTLGNISLNNNTNLKEFWAYNCGLTTLDLSNNPLIEYLRIGTASTNSNNITSVINGINDMVNMEELIISNSGLSNEAYIEVDNMPKLKNVEAIKSDSIIWGVVVNLNLVKIMVGETSIGIYQTIDFSTYPNVKNITVDVSSIRTTLVNMNSLSGSVTNSIRECTLEEYVFITNWTITSLNIFLIGAGMKEITIKQQNHVQVYINGINLEKINNLNYGNKNRVILYNSKLTELSINNIGTITELSFGGGTETFTSIAGFSSKSNGLSVLIIQPCAFIFSGEIKNNFNLASVLVIKNINCEVFYTITSSFPSTMRKVLIYPKAGVGLADATTGGDQVSKLIVDLSLKNWTTTSQILNWLPDSNFGIIDLRGNCKAPTPSGALTTALALLTSKGVTVLTN